WFARVLGEIWGGRSGPPLFADAALEIARLARQVTRLPAAMSAVVADGDATACWNLDTTGWVDLPGSCFTYSAAGRSMLATRHVTTPMERSLYSPPPGARKVFRRKRLLRLVQTDRRLHLFHSMHDNVQGFDVHFEIDLDASEIVAADSVTSRLPYSGICSEPQGKITSLIGQPADAGLRKRIQSLIGGAGGRAQLFHLTADLLKLLSLS